MYKRQVVQQTHVNISTLRAWEQRYGIPEPNRSDHGHRLYSQRDIAVVKWLKQCTDNGLAISQAVQLLRESHLMDGLQNSSQHISTETDIASASWREMRAQLLDALLTVNLRKAHVLVNTASIMHPVETVISELFQTILGIIGERWENGQISIAEEHLVTNFIRQRLLALSQLFAPFAHGPRLVCACAPHEQHELGMLMLAVLMEQRGWEVIYLGQDLPPDGLSNIVARITPAIFCVTASMAEHVPGIFEIAREIEHFDSHQVVFAYTCLLYTSRCV